MLRKTLIVSMLLAAAGPCGAEDVPAAGEPMANAAQDPPAQDVAAHRAPAQSQSLAQTQTPSPPIAAEGGDKTLSGMSILGNQEAPKALVIVPWKSSRIGDSLGLADGLDDSRAPVDKEVFMRELGYYEIRSNAK